MGNLSSVAPQAAQHRRLRAHSVEIIESAHRGRGRQVHFRQSLPVHQKRAMAQACSLAWIMGDQKHGEKS